MPHRRPRPALAAACLTSLAAACVPQPVAWRDAAAAASAAVASGAVSDSADAVPPPDAAVCPGSARAAAARAERYVVWWSPRADSTVALLAAHTSDGGRSWSRRYVVDSLDRGGRGCRRPPPSVAADTVNGYVHVAYFLDAPEGTGFFYAHLMDPRAEFEVPAPIVYGDRPGATAVASDDQTVAVAYENPNSGRAQIAVAVSRTAGHTFEGKTIPASGTDTDADAPRVTVRGRDLTVAWREAGAHTVTRTGMVK